MKLILLTSILAFMVTSCVTEPESEMALNFSLSKAETIASGDTVIITRGQLGVLRDLRPVSITREGATIRAFGSFVTSCSGPLPEAEMDRNDGDKLLLTIRFPPDGSSHTICASVPQPYTYEARIAASPGHHQIVIRHFGDILRSDGIVLEKEVDVR